MSDTTQGRKLTENEEYSKLKAFQQTAADFIESDKKNDWIDFHSFVEGLKYAEQEKQSQQPERSAEEFFYSWKEHKYHGEDVAASSMFDEDIIALMEEYRHLPKKEDSEYFHEHQYVDTSTDQDVCYICGHRKQPEKRESDSWNKVVEIVSNIGRNSDLSNNDRIEAINKLKSFWFSPPPVREVSDEEMKGIAKDVVGGGDSNEAAYYWYLHGMKKMRYILTGK